MASPPRAKPNQRLAKRSRGSKVILSFGHPHPNPPPSRGRELRVRPFQVSSFPPRGGRTGWGDSSLKSALPPIPDAENFYCFLQHTQNADKSLDHQIIYAKNIISLALHLKTVYCAKRCDGDEHPAHHTPFQNLVNRRRLAHKFRPQTNDDLAEDGQDILALHAMFELRVEVGFDDHFFDG